ncbi:hypothetical protein HQ308_20005 [Rhodococcus sp. BP-241]|uniref:hypothetical protein n=1 Tax=Rhodococcus sp. BP-241 TaxID=2739441 RepID=UPI001C9A41DC|nr:hypothetical protein [Rhodococcus sp. BP-241]MBY6709077.1 hypothetical protein [Rhodococcus sp. BP-241]
MHTGNLLAPHTSPSTSGSAAITRIYWAAYARYLREHAAADAAARTADTGEPHTSDPMVVRIAALCDSTAALCPDLPNPSLETLVTRALAVRPAASTVVVRP